MGVIFKNPVSRVLLRGVMYRLLMWMPDQAVAWKNGFFGV